jgi:uncharacterized LabA/DUF88 family protein
MPQKQENVIFSMDQDQTVVRNRRMAMLIDGDNAQPSLISNMLAESGKYGMVIVRRIYGDWTTANMNGWKDTLQTHAIQPIQQFRYTIGKNATDSAMIIDAMDILYEDRVDGFCLVSSDSDYTRLATRIREKGIFVMGIGRQTTPRAFVNACDVFVFTENLQKNLRKETRPARSQEPRKRGEKPEKADKVDKAEKPEKTERVDRQAEETALLNDPIPVLKQAFDLAVQDDGWAFLGVMGTQLRQLDPSFDPRTYGYRQLSILMQAYPDVFELEMGKKGDGTFNVYVRLKE